MPAHHSPSSARSTALAVVLLALVFQPAQFAVPRLAAAQAVPLDDFLCYGVTRTRGRLCTAAAPQSAGGACTVETDCGGIEGGTAFCVANKAPAGLAVGLADRFEDLDFRVTGPAALCMAGAGDPGSIADPDASFAGYGIKALRTSPPSPGHTRRTGLRVSDRFGRLLLATVKPARLMVPDAWSSTGPVPEPTPTLDHFKCYRVKVQKKVCEDSPAVRCKSDLDCTESGLAGPCSAGLARGLHVRVATSLHPQARLQELLRPTRLCNPVDKRGEGILDPAARLLCYAVRTVRFTCSVAAPQNAGFACRSETDCGGVDRVTGYCAEQEAFTRIDGLHVHDQFGPALLDAIRVAELCVPAAESAPASCGDDVADAGEVCDGLDLNGEDCTTRGFAHGILGCAADCSAFDTSACSDAVCGDDVAEAPEVCDGVDLEDEDCVTRGFVQGALGCLADCSAFDTSACSDAVCGDDVAEAPEVCDGDDLEGEDCVTQGFVQGELGCLADCSDFDTAACIDLPPDPMLVAGEVDPTVSTSLGVSTAFLYEGSDPIQAGVAPGVLERRRAAVVRGRVVERDATPIPAVTVSVVDHPEFGSTLTRADGGWDLAVNGGGEVVVRFEKRGYLPSQRQAPVPWLEFVELDDVVLVGLDPVVSVVDLGDPSPMHVVRGSEVVDSDGTRRATLLLPGAAAAELVFADGHTQPVTTLSIRATEYTVGPNGPRAMPGELPPTSAYTYAVEFSADEAIAVGAVRVAFDRTIFAYLENFLAFPTGTPVPAAFYDRDRAAWVPGDDGLVIEILSITGGLADVDSDGDGVAEDAGSLAALAMTDEERAELALLYAPGQRLWRVGITHFSPHDFNLGVRPYAGAKTPDNEEASTQQHQEDSSVQKGWGAIDIENQALREDLGIPGSALRLHYASDRMKGRIDRSSLDIELSGASVPASLSAIRLEVSVAGQRFVQEFPPLAAQRTTFEWDGKDVWGRTMHGAVPARVKIGYLYPAYYTRAPDVVRSFAISSGLVVPGDVPARDRFALWQEYTTMLETSPAWFATKQGVGGWTLDAHHAYDPVAGVVHFGDGMRRRVSTVNLVFERVAGTGDPGYGADGIPALESPLYYAIPAVAPDGTVYYDDGTARIRRLRPDGIVDTVAGNGTWGNSGDGGLAIDAEIRDVGDIAVGPDGSLYFTDYWDCVMRRVWPNGVIDRIAGTGPCGFTGGLGPATAVQLDEIYAIAIAPDGTVYFAERGSYQLRKISPDGEISRVAGTGVRGYGGDGGPALDALLDNGTMEFGLGPDGSLYLYDSYRVRRITPDGIIQTIAGTGVIGPPAGTGDGGPALEATFRIVRDLAVDAEGNIYLIAYDTLRVIGTDGIIRRVAGSLDSTHNHCEGQAATDTRLQSAYALGLGPDGSVLLQGYRRLCRIRPAIPALGEFEIAIPSEDAGLLYVFDADGRHLRTVHSLTGATLLTFGYDGAGRLVSVTDADGDVTAVERDTNGSPTSILAPHGQRTSLTLDGAGLLASATSPSGETVHYAYDGGGLLTSMTTPNDDVYGFTYDAAGRLTRADDPEGGSTSLTRTALADGYEILMTSGEGHVSTHRVQTLSTGDRRRTLVGTDGLTSVTTIATTGKRSLSLPDGAVVTVTPGPDPRFGMQAPLTAERKSISPLGRTYTMANARSVTLADPYDVMSLTSLTQTTTVNGRVYTTAWDTASRQFTSTTPGGRRSWTTIDAQGRVVEQARDGIESITHAYDAHGRRASTIQGSAPDDRALVFGYGASGFLETVDDPTGSGIAVTRDASGRVLARSVAGTLLAEFGYDANGNRTRVTPAGRPDHVVLYDGVDRPVQVTAPDVGPENDVTLFDYDLDRRLVAATRADGEVVATIRDAAGRPVLFDIDDADVTLTHDAATGRGSSLVTTDGVTTNYTFDSAMIRQVEWQGPVAGHVGYTWDNNGRLVSVTVNGEGEARTHDVDDWLTGVGAMTLVRDPANGLLRGSTLGSLTDVFDTNGFAEPIGYRAAWAGVDVFDADVTRDKLGRITSRTETVGGVTDTWSYGYDELGRLETVEKNAAPWATYEYDTNGNRLGYDGPGGAWTATYDAQDRLLARGTTSYTYGAAGELRTKTDGADVTTYDYDALGSLRSVELPDGHLVEYVVDGAGRRIGKKIDGVLLQGFLYAGLLHPVAELDATGNVVSRFVYATRAGVPDFLVRGGATYRIVSDLTGSPRLVVAVADGTIVQRLDYDEFGNVLLDTNPGFQPFGFAGGLHDRDTGLLRFGARDYDPEVGRWTAKDPLGFAAGSANLYTFAGNQPLTRRDPTGLLVFAIGGEVGAMFGDVLAVAGSVGTGGFFATKEDLSVTIGNYRTASLRMGGGMGGGVQPGVVVAVSPLGTYENFVGSSTDLAFDVDVLGGASLTISTPEIAPDAGNFEKVKNALRSTVAIGVGLGPSVGASVTVGGSHTSTTQCDDQEAYVTSVQDEMWNPDDAWSGEF